MKHTCETCGIWFLDPESLALHEELASAIYPEDLDRILPKFTDSCLNRRKKLEEWGYA